MPLTGKDIETIRLKLGMNQSEFAELIGYERSTISKMEKQTAPFSKTIEAKFLLKLGAQNSHLITPTLQTHRTAQAGRASTANYKVSLRNLLTPVIEDLPEATYDVFQAEGSSMIPTVHQGDWLLCRLDSCDTIIDGRVYVLVVDNKQLSEFRRSGIWIKRIYHRKQGGYITCKSDNVDGTEAFSTFRVKVSEVLECWYPVRKISGQLSDPNRDLYTKMDELESRIEQLESELNIEQ